MAGRTVVNLALTGVPRGGTTLACQLLGRSRNAVSLFEPMTVLDLPQAPEAASERVMQFFAAARAQLLSEGCAPSKQQGGQVPDNPFGASPATGERPLQVELGQVRATQPLSPDFALVIKHNAAFAALLPELVKRVPVLAIVRNPLAVLLSWNSVPLPVRDGRLPAGEWLDPALATALAEEPQCLRRQLRVLDWFYQRFATQLSELQVLRYEDVIASSGALLYQRAGLTPLSEVQLQDRNVHPQGDAAAIADRVAALLDTPGHWLRWYPRSEIEALALRLVRAPEGS